ncbi:MAG: hypothetical protein ACI9MC_001072 [Kiritimatiellia bacterium]|jgi:hypothetical protein
MRLLLLAIALSGCTGEPGIITVTVADIAGHDGKLWITEARSEDGRQWAVGCVPIDADPFAGSTQLVEIVGETPCDPAGPTAVDAGSYTINTSVMQGGSQTPDLCATREVEVNGDVEAVMPELAACD